MIVTTTPSIEGRKITAYKGIAVGETTADGAISLETQVKDSMLNIKIRNNGQLASDKLNGSKGFGIENTRQRLKLLYGDKASFSIINEDDNTVLTEVKLPQNI